MTTENEGNHSVQGLQDSSRRRGGRPRAPVRVWLGPKFAVNEDDSCPLSQKRTIADDKAPFSLAVFDSAGTDCKNTHRAGDSARQCGEPKSSLEQVAPGAPPMELDLPRKIPGLEELADLLRFCKEPVTIAVWRVSETVQDEEMQKRAFEKAGCDITIGWKRSGYSKTTLHWQLLQTAAGMMRPRDTIVFWRFDRMGRIAHKALKFIQDMADEKKFFKCLQLDSLDNTTAAGKMFIGQMAVFSQYESDNTSERINAKLPLAWEKGHYGGGRRKLSGRKQENAMRDYLQRPISDVTGKKMTVQELALKYGVCDRTFRRWVKNKGLPNGIKNRQKFMDSLSKRRGIQFESLEAYLEATNDPRFGLNPAKPAWQRRAEGAA